MRIGYTPSTWQRSRREEREDEGSSHHAETVQALPEVEPALRPEGAEPPLPDLAAPPETQRDLFSFELDSSPPPPQETLLATALRPQQLVDIVMLDFHHSGESDVRRSLLHDFSPEGRLILAQTSPPIRPSYAGRPLEVTFLSRYRDVPGGRWLRVGYQTPLKKVIPEYRLGRDFVDAVVLVDPPQELEPTSVRLHYRVIAPSDLDLRLNLMPQDQPLGILDLSANGARFYHYPSLELLPGTRCGLALISGEFRLELKAWVLRSQTLTNHLEQRVSITAVAFRDLEQEPALLLDRLLNAVYRHLLAKRSGIKQ